MTKAIVTRTRYAVDNEACELHCFTESSGKVRHPLMSTIAACQKSPEWRYEGEWRFVSPWGLLNECPKFPLSHPPKSITLGVKSSFQGKELVHAIADNLHIPVFQARPVSNQFKLAFDALPGHGNG